MKIIVNNKERNRAYRSLTTTSFWCIKFHIILFPFHHNRKDYLREQRQNKTKVEKKTDDKE